MADELRPGPADGAADLFSVDADAHLRKLASCMFPTPALLPVEMVRSALARRAASVVVEIRRRRLSVADDGSGIPPDQWRELSRAFDPALAAGEREKAISALQGAAATGIGLLAAFVPDASSIRIENSPPGGAAAMTIAGGRLREISGAGLGSGTRITVRRRSGPAAAERKLLRELCAAANAAITLNGQLLPRRPLLLRSLAQQRVDLGCGREAAQVAIPARGEACRIWLLDQQIPWQAYVSPPCHGLVFEAAIEASALPSADEYHLLAEAAHGLYIWLAGRYESFPPAYQERIEELVFNRAKAAGDLRLLSAFSPFRLWRARRRLNLEEVRRMAERRALLAIPAEGAAGLRIDRHAEALLLTPRQRDFLLNHLRLPLAEPTAAMGRRSLRAALLARISRAAARLGARLPRPLSREVPEASLSVAERRLCRGLEDHWQRHAGGPPPLHLAVAMAAGRGLAPAFLRRDPQSWTLFLRRGHPMVAKAGRLVAADGDNAELAFAALAPGELLTAEPHWAKILA